MTGDAALRVLAVGLGVAQDFGSVVRQFGLSVPLRIVFGLLRAAVRAARRLPRKS